MRIRVSSSVGKSVVRLFAAVLLASVATGCSSDASRFGGLFSKSDNLTTSSIARSNVPIPQGDVQGGNMASSPVMSQSNRQDAVNQPFPDPVNTASAPVSRAREASTPINVQRVALADPSAKARDTSLSQPLPAARETAKVPQSLNADPISTGTTAKAGKGGWSTVNAPAVLLRQGDTTATLSKRFGVPESEILKANGLKSSSQAEPGQRILIPTFGVAGSAAKASASDAAASLDVDKQKNIPLQSDDREVAILPGQSKSREKGGNNADMASGKQPVSGDGNGQGGTYTVKAGDSINRIAKANGVSVDALRQANGLTTAAIRIGQTLKIPGGNAPATDQVVTASVPAKASETKVAKADAAKPAEYTAPVAKQSVTEVASKEDTSEASPKATGISKYRWPVRGAVIAGYGANVEGNRNDGINISVPEGTPIKAAENGVVIYSGSSLKELGNAVLVRHDDGTVTVYGNASELKVQRGQKIQRGQTLAASGMSGTATQPQVHFEVRKNASAVNPATYLE